ncbi:MAG: oligosaccharide flippase family protein [Hyphomicrobium sp.]
MRRVLSRVSKSEFIRNIAILSTGTAFAQVITVSVSPILSRLYDPEAFGILGVIISIAGPLTMIAALRYEQAIVLARDDEEAVNVLVLCCAVVSSICALSAFVMVSAGDWIATQLGAPAAAALLLAVPFFVFFGGSFRNLSAWANRRKSYVRLSIASISRSATIAATQVALGLASSGGGLVYGRILGSAVANFVLGVRIFQEERRIIAQAVGFRSLKAAALAHDQFPKYSMPRTLLVSVSRNLPTIFLAAFFSPAAAGLYWFTARLLEMPTTLIGNAVRRVFYERAVALHHDGKSVLPLLTKTTLALMAMGVVGVAFIIATAPPLFDFVFGSEWRPAGVYAQWLVLWWFASFCNVPSAMLIPVYDLQRRFFGYEIVGFTLRALAIWLATLIGDDITAIALYSVVGFVFHAFITVYIFIHARSIKGEG